jgi:hypothetical protein
MELLEQRMVALEKANTARSAMLAVKVDLRSRSSLEARAHVAGLLRQNDSSIRPMKLRLLLGAVPRFGQAKIQVILRSVDVRSGDRRVDELTDRQRLKLASILSGDRA